MKRHKSKKNKLKLLAPCKKFVMKKPQKGTVFKNLCLMTKIKKDIQPFLVKFVVTRPKFPQKGECPLSW